MTHKHHLKRGTRASESESQPPDQLGVEIEHLAYALYCQCGYEHGHDLEHWAEAERQVLEQHQRKPKTGG